MIQVRTFKLDGKPHRSWEAELVRRENTLLVLDGIFDKEITHDLLGTIAAGTQSLEYYWLDRWYNVFRFSDPGGGFRNFYCNVNVPPIFDGNVLSYVDLDLDVLVAPDFSYQIVDVEDFEANTSKYGYSNEVQDNARKALAELTSMIQERRFPFEQA
ncbi:MAG TPA: DUF402 domain-containing protein [Pyrinomonadaceae bacterium]|nr:DUF402 domain-containing protein [Pyrinomonadaceae bacterium]